MKNRAPLVIADTECSVFYIGDTMYKLTKIYKSYADKVVLQDVNLTLKDEVIALIGENGAGKTTLLKIMLGVIEADDGNIVHNGTVGYVPQHPVFEPTVRECFEAKVEQWQIDIALQDVGLDKPMGFKTHELSGGQKTRLSIAMALAGTFQPDVLLLDEPTNNLDTEALMWLRDFVKRFKGSILIVSHDRSFINETCSKIVELKNGTLKVYSGNYEEYKAAKDLETLHAIESYEAQIEEQNRLHETLRRKQNDSEHTHKHMKRSDNDKAQRDYFKNRVTRGLGQQVRALKTRLEELSDLEKPAAVKNYDITLDGKNHDSRLLLMFKDVKVDYLEYVLPSIEIRGNNRLRIHGANGTGKSTILKLASGLAQPSDGDITVGQNVSTGYLSQDTDQLDHTITALENLEKIVSDKTAIFREARALGLSDKDLKKNIENLSRGQQTKVSFAKLLLASHDLLILDEPTNHLDIPTKELIENALRSYNGGLLVSSHDEYFIQSINITESIILGEN